MKAFRDLINITGRSPSTLKGLERILLGLCSKRLTKLIAKEYEDVVAKFGRPCGIFKSNHDFYSSNVDGFL